MFTSRDFDRVVYKFPRLEGRGKLISGLLGFDSEALTTGKPYLYCISDGTFFENPETIINDILDAYPGTHFAVYNLKYDSGAILYTVPPEHLDELRIKTFTEYNGYKLEYIPHKNLRISRGKKCIVNFWDVSQYFSMSLDKAAKTYLGDAKIIVGTKSFTPEYVRKNRKKLIEYCIYDALLCARLGNYLIKKLSEFGIRTTALYSSASLSFRYFADRGKIVTCWRYWKYYRESLAYAVDAYEGGKFEVTARGSFTGYEYDIVSAYPYEIANLIDISLARNEKNRAYQAESQYGFIRARINNPEGKPIPCGIMIKNVRVYPAGQFYTTITKNEYDYLISAGIETEIIDAHWLFVGKVKRPYAGIINTLFELKEKYKGRDVMLTEVSKRMLNSFYGKTVQAIPDWKDRIVCGVGFNPFYGSVITANCRIAVTRIQAQYPKECIAVHTDSAIMTAPLPPDQVSGKLGAFSFKETGPGIMLACGQYEIASKGAYKGFVPLDGDTWTKILSQNKNRSIIPYPVVEVNTWLRAIERGRSSEINLFEEKKKDIDLNCDTKRAWMKNVKAGDLLKPLEHSLPKIVYQDRPPDYWKS